MARELLPGNKQYTLFYVQVSTCGEKNTPASTNSTGTCGLRRAKSWRSWSVADVEYNVDFGKSWRKKYCVCRCNDAPEVGSITTEELQMFAL